MVWIEQRRHSVKLKKKSVIIEHIPYYSISMRYIECSNHRDKKKNGGGGMEDHEERTISK